MNYLLVDIHDYSEEELLTKNSGVAYALLIEKNIKKQSLEGMIEKIAENCKGNKRIHTMRRIIKYILAPLLGDRVELVMNQFKYEEVEEEMKTAQDYIKEQIEEVKMKSAREGKREGKMECISQMIQEKMPIDKISLYTGISKREITRIVKEEKSGMKVD